MPGRATNEPANYFAFGFQSAKDSEASTFQFLKHLDGTSMEPDIQTEDIREGGDGQEVSTRIKTRVSADGQLVNMARPETAIREAIAALGADAVTAPQGVGTTASGICNEHQAVPTTPVPYLTTEQRSADEIERFTNVKAGGLDIEWEAGRPFKITVPLIGGGSYYQRDIASTLTPTRETTPFFMYPGATVALDGAGNADMTKGRISVKRNVDTDIQTVGLSRADAVELNFDVEVSGTLEYQDRTFYKKVQYGGGSQVPVDLATGAIKLTQSYGSGTNVRYFEVGVNQMQYTDIKFNRLDADGKTVYYDFTAQSYKSATHTVYVKALIASQAAIV